ncbi:methyltransferase family protein [Streptomyces sp. 3211.6]|uniref:SAM-dependent methyltransferase n=1 Tax=Streptomyces sp. 3211.6 TaxID=1938845 RepID=UPI000EB0FDB2|nr:class I SAM-dependent methyltransferase [Streptomyces sp. 3211.6]RKT04469.1 methyltransferase family protein [Streptomyces sp. 3211.6]
MNREQISKLAHTHHPIKSPLNDDSVTRLLADALPRGDERVLDLGCGSAEWLLRALTTHPNVHAEGVDISESDLTDARHRAKALDVSDRLTLHHQRAEDFTPSHPFDLILCVGSTHALGGLLPTLEAARTHLAPGGRVLIGEGIWERTPTPEAVDMLGDFADLPTTIDRITAAGWTPVQGHTSTRQELDAYEWSNWGTLADWALDHPTHPDSPEILTWATTRRTDWLRTYRDTWGFATLTLRRTTD